MEQVTAREKAKEEAYQQYLKGLTTVPSHNKHTHNKHFSHNKHTLSAHCPLLVPTHFWQKLCFV